MIASFSSLPYKRLAVLLVCLFGLWACRGVDSDGGINDGEGEINVWITDAPAEDVDRVLITITALVIEAADGEEIEATLDRPLEVDLLDLIDESELREDIIEDYSLPVGNYTAIQLVLDESRLFVEVGGSQYLATIPEEEAEGLRVEFNVAIEDDSDLDLTIDFDLRKSLRDLGSNTYELHPALRIVRTDRSGNLRGTVAEALLREDDCDNGIDHDEGNAVYVFSGGNANFQDIQGNTGDPLATGRVERDFGVDRYEFVVPFLPRGSYTAYFTCDGAVDDPELDDSLEMLFTQGIDVDINAEQTTDIVFD